jgi:hypothetical protein
VLEHQLVPYARVRELFADLVAARVSVGTLTRRVQLGAEALRAIEEAIKGRSRRRWRCTALRQACAVPGE